MDNASRQRMMEFGEWLRSLRLRKGFVSCARLAQAARLAASHVATLERGDVLPRWGTVRRLADAMELSEAERVGFYAAIEKARRPDEVAELLTQHPDSLIVGSERGRGENAAAGAAT